MIPGIPVVHSTELAPERDVCERHSAVNLVFFGDSGQAYSQSVLEQFPVPCHTFPAYRSDSTVEGRIGGLHLAPGWNHDGCLTRSRLQSAPWGLHLSSWCPSTAYSAPQRSCPPCCCLQAYRAYLPRAAILMPASSAGECAAQKLLLAGVIRVHTYIYGGVQLERPIEI